MLTWSWSSWGVTVCWKESESVDKVSPTESSSRSSASGESSYHYYQYNSQYVCVVIPHLIKYNICFLTVTRSWLLMLSPKVSWMANKPAASWWAQVQDCHPYSLKATPTKPRLSYSVWAVSMSSSSLICVDQASGLGPQPVQDWTE